MEESHVVVLSNDPRLCGEVEAAVAGNPGVRAVFAAWEVASHWRPARADRIVVIDDEGHSSGAQWVEAFKTCEHAAAIIYLAAHHSLELERQVRQAGASFYAAKSDCGSNLSRVIGAFLRADQL